MRRTVACAAALLLGASPADAQKLRDRIASLATFGDWGVPLRVGASGADGRGLVPSDAFAPQAGGPNAALLSFVLSWMQASAANAPISSTGGGTTFSFVGGTPVRDPVSPGPIFGEHATTLGRGALLAGANYTGVRYSRVRGVPADALQLRFTPAPGSAAAGTELNLDVALNYHLDITSLHATFGLLDRVDVGVVVPVVHARLRGQSVAELVPAAGGAPQLRIAGTPDAPVLSSRQSFAGSATGVGDVALRVKGSLLDRPRAAIGVLGDVRLPTGDEANLLGSGSLSMRALAIASGRLGGFAPRVSAGYLYYADAAINDALVATAGFDQDVAPGATLALSVVSEFHAGRSAYRLPPDAVAAGNIPSIRDDALSFSGGLKLRVARVRTVLNAVVPLTRGGPRPDFAYTVGVERDF
jgi:hypothetical protein